MRKPTLKTKQWNKIHVRNLMRRKVTRKNNSYKKYSRKSNLSKSKIQITCPEILSLNKNFDDVVKLIGEIRRASKRHRNEKVEIDFKPIRKVAPAAALVLAAELFRWNRLRKSKLVVVDVNDWDKKVRNHLEEMGFFELLDVSPSFNEQIASTDTGTRYVKFATGSKADGDTFVKWRTKYLDPHIELPHKNLLFSAVTEAMTNVVHHAYPKSRTSVNHWWVSAAFDLNQRRVRLLIYDQGIGIPETLPRTHAKYLQRFATLNLLDDHGKLIQQAHKLNRSSVNKDRGFGLSDIKRYIEELDYAGIYRVKSLKGEYIVEMSKRRNMTEKNRNSSKQLNGTLIEWDIRLR